MKPETDMEKRALAFATEAAQFGRLHLDRHGLARLFLIFAEKEISMQESAPAAEPHEKTSEAGA